MLFSQNNIFYFAISAKYGVLFCYQQKIEKMYTISYKKYTMFYRM